MKQLLNILVAASLIWALPLQAATQFEENKQYTRILPQPPQGKPGDKIEVTEFFMYSCPHCYNFEPTLDAWLAKKPADIEVVRVPAMFGGPANLHAKVYYALEAIGELDRIHELFFDEIHKKKNRALLACRKDSQTGGMDCSAAREAIEAFMQSQGVDLEKFRGAMNSFAVAAKTNRATSLMRRYGIRAVPKLVVDGRYRFERGLNYKDMPVLAEQLAEEIRQDRKEAAE